MRARYWMAVGALAAACATTGAAVMVGHSHDAAAPPMAAASHHLAEGSHRGLPRNAPAAAPAPAWPSPAWPVPAGTAPAPHARRGPNLAADVGDLGGWTAPLRHGPPRHPAVVPGPLTGLPTSWSDARRRPLAVMVENYSPDSRPQAGLDQASLVFETVAEGGITRFMAVYLEHDAPVVGPVRSARVYFNAWANGIHAILVHAGGNDDALAQLFTLRTIADLNEVAFEDSNYTAHVPYFSRSADRPMPHNLYTYPARVRRYLQTRHVQLSGDFPAALPHRNPNAPTHRPAGGILDLDFSTPDYAVQYRYDRATNRWLRWMGGAPHVDAADQRQIAPGNVVVLLATIAPDPNGGPDNPGAVYVQSTGRNRAYFYRDGYQFAGSWHKAHGGTHLDLLDSRGRPFRFDPGQTWIEVLPTGGGMHWTPGKR